MGEPSADDSDLAALDARVRADVARRGYHLGLVPPEAATPGWASTIGLVERFRHPELVAFGPDLGFLRALVEALAERVRSGSRYADGDRPEGVLQDARVALRGVDAKWIPVFLGNAAWHHRSERFPVLQCFWPDRAGAFPWEAEFDPEWRADQPLLYHLATHEALSEALLDVLRREGAL